MSRSMTAAPPREPENDNPETGLELFSGSSRDPNEITARIERAMQMANVLSPVTQCPNLPPFHEVAVSSVKADCEVNSNGFPVRPGEIYKISKDSYGLGKPFLNRVKRSVGVVWVPEQCGRRDDESDPYFVRHFSFGVVQKFDGGIETIKGTKTLDLRDGSARVKKIIAKKVASAIYDLKYDAQNKNFRITDEMIAKTRKEAEERAWDDINAMRAEIETLAETGSEMRALRSLGMKTSYTLKELQKPFVIFSLVVTGKHENPEFERMFAEKAAEKALDSRRTLYGSTPEPMTIPSHVLEQPVPRRTAPPPVGSTTGDDLSDLETSGPVIDIEAEPSRGSMEDAVETLDTPNKAQSTEPQPLVMPFGDHQGKFLDDSSIEVADLEFTRDWLSKAIEDPTKKAHKLTYAALKSAIEVEIRRRNIPADRRPQATAQEVGGSPRVTKTQPKSERF